MVLSLFLFTLYTADLRHNSTACQMQKFSEDSAIVNLIIDVDDRSYSGLIQSFVYWCLQNHHKINVGESGRTGGGYLQMLFPFPYAIPL